MNIGPSDDELVAVSAGARWSCYECSQNSWMVTNQEGFARWITLLQFYRKARRHARHRVRVEVWIEEAKRCSKAANSVSPVTTR